MQRAKLAAVMFGAWGACSGASEARVAVDAATQSVADDRDADGLCDASELALGSDPDRADSDGDGLLDGHELIAGSDLRDRDDPGVDHIVFLRTHASIDFPVTLRVDGSGADVVATFSDRNAFDPDERRAAAFYRGSDAVAAEPPENVRGIAAAAARFEAVRGATQLTFSLHFEAGAAADAGAVSSNAACAAVLPFDYAGATDDGTELDVSNTKERFVLIVSNDSPPLSAAEYCLPVACL